MPDPVPQPVGPQQPTPQAPTVIKLFGAEIPAPPWGVPIFFVLALVSASAYSWLQWIAPAIRAKPAVVAANTPRDTSALLQTKEDNIHGHVRGDVLQTHPQYGITTEIYPDGCVLVTRVAQPDLPAQWHYFLRPDRIPQDSPPPTPAALRRTRPSATPILPVAAQSATGTCSGHCLSSHPGTAKTYNGAPNGCWVQVFKEYSDGCKQYAWYNSCYSYWQTGPDRQPKVNWTCCRH